MTTESLLLSDVKCSGISSGVDPERGTFSFSCTEGFLRISLIWPGELDRVDFGGGRTSAIVHDCEIREEDRAADLCFACVL